MAGSNETLDAEQRCSDRGLTGQAFDACVAEEIASQQQEPPEPALEEVRRSQDGGSGSDGGQTLNQTQSGDGIQQNEQQSDPSGSIVQNAFINGRRQGRRARRSCDDLRTRRSAQRELERRPRSADTLDRDGDGQACERAARKLPTILDESGTPLSDASQAGVGVTLSVVS